MFGIKLTTHREQFKILVLGLATIGEGIVQVVSLGFLTCNWRSAVLFSDWMDP